MKSFKPPQSIPFDKKSIFLAGTIDQGNSIDWQKKVEESLYSFDVYIYNPRRDDWNPEWDNKYENPQFYQQVNWELNALDHADIIFLNFLPNSKSPITLLELGLYAKDSNKNIIVCCPDTYERAANVKITCDRYGITVYESLEEGLHYFYKNFEDLRKKHHE